MKKRLYIVALLVGTVISIWHMLLGSPVYENKEDKEQILHSLPGQERSSRLQFRLNDSLSRFGDELDFDYSTCPENSIMIDSIKRSRPPLHSDCPQVFIIGVRKGGTSSLILYLTKHSNFTSVYLQEHYCGETAYFSKGYERNQSWQSYTSLFPKDKMTGDSSVDNLVNCYAPERIYESCGKVKVIVLLRDPVERFQSHYRFSVLHKNDGFIRRSITSVLDDHINALMAMLQSRNITLRTSLHDLAKTACLFQQLAKNLVYEGLYLLHLHRWLCNFPANNVLILNTEEFGKFPAKILTQVMDFIGLSRFDDDQLKSVVSVKHNTNPIKQTEGKYRLLTAIQRQRLGDLYHHYNTELFNLLHWSREQTPWN